MIGGVQYIGVWVLICVIMGAPTFVLSFFQIATCQCSQDVASMTFGCPHHITLFDSRICTFFLACNNFTLIIIIPAFAMMPGKFISFTIFGIIMFDRTSSNVLGSQIVYCG